LTFHFDFGLDHPVHGGYGWGSPTPRRRSNCQTKKLKYQSIYVETSVLNKCQCSFYCALFTLHVLLRTEVSTYIDWYMRNRMHNPMIKIKIWLWATLGARNQDELAYRPSVAM
jgi:hypothetical protein